MIKQRKEKSLDMSKNCARVETDPVRIWATVD